MQHAYPLKHSLPLSLLQHLSSASLTPAQRQDVCYLTDTQLRSIAEMDLLRLGRLSVQTVSQEAWAALSLMGEKGGWGEWKGKWNAGSQSGKGKGKDETAQVKSATKRKKVDKEPVREAEEPAAPKASSATDGQTKPKTVKRETPAAPPENGTRRKSPRVAKVSAPLTNTKRR